MLVVAKLRGGMAYDCKILAMCRLERQGRSLGIFPQNSPKTVAPSESFFFVFTSS